MSDDKQVEPIRVKLEAREASDFEKGVIAMLIIMSFLSLLAILLM